MSTVPQCIACQHWQARGGTILPATQQCVAVEDEPHLGDRTRAILTRVCRVLAAGDRCPAFNPFPVYPDAYRAEDRPIPIGE